MADAQAPPKDETPVTREKLEGKQHPLEHEYRNNVMLIYSQPRSSPPTW
jgi:hypothetical protein